ncbi:EAL domain-containing protein [Paraneptunicella aestuarii]|uniref:EAL domain-containing protein n=1 Tax=Paraneptunicella aestuarii TaxID=2831148 RepID=UPI001E4816C9|nr:EAL domain-containing protein [Paraneptunicella aestuarii]UAA38519.1 EAL domain-containing protein [Paraneptunicella aestuarii]
MQVQTVKGNFPLDSIVPFFQPIMDMSDNVVWSYECLARLVTQSEQTFLPSEFLHLVENQRCSSELTQRMFHHSAQYFRDRNTGWSINISERDVLDPLTTRFLSEYLSQYPNTKRVSLELMAETVTKYPKEFNAFLVACKDMDIKLVIDNFRNVSAGITDVLDMPIDGIKIEADILARMLKDKVSHRLLRNLRSKAQKNNIIVIAEHIEDQESLAAVTSLDIRYGQGFYFSKPQSRLS